METTETNKQRALVTPRAVDPNMLVSGRKLTICRLSTSNVKPIVTTCI